MNRSRPLPAWSACVVVHDRIDALPTLFQALERCRPQPAELVLVFMNDPVVPVPDLPFAVRTGHCEHPGALPLACARNRAIELASHEALVFLAPDCIPHTYLAHHVLPPLEARGGLHMLDVRYLPPGAAEAGLPSDFELEVLSSTYPGRPAASRCRAMADPAAFQGTAFAIHQRTMHAIGGFDERYLGCHGPDGELAARLARAGHPLWHSPGKAWHRHHPAAPPDLQLLVANVNRHRQEHAQWILTDRLRAHAAAGRIDWRPGAERAVVRDGMPQRARAS